MNKITLVRLFPLHSDSRAVRYIRNISPSSTLFWNESHSIETSSFPLMNKRGILRPIIYLINFFYLSVFSFIQHTLNKNIIIAMDLDSYISSSFFGVFGKKVIFDCVDPFSESRLRQLIWLKPIINRIEESMMKSSRLVIFPSKTRMTYYKKTPSNHLVVRNIPDLNSLPKKVNYKTDTTKLTIGYIGGITNSRYLDKLCDTALEFPSINVIIFGDGIYLKELKNKYSKAENISFRGRFDYSMLSTCYEQIDISFACYDPSIYFHRFAAPNKFYESLLFRKPVIVNSEVIESKEMIKNKFAIEFEIFKDMIAANNWKCYLDPDIRSYPSHTEIREMFNSDISNLKIKI